MSLLENAKQKINSLFTSNPIAISYSLIGMTTIILGYYTFFENDIDTQVEDSPTPTFPYQTETQQNGGKSKKNHKTTKKNKPNIVSK